MTQVKTVQTVAKLEEILATPGLDEAFIGPMDLAAEPMSRFKKAYAPRL